MRGDTLLQRSQSWRGFPRCCRRVLNPVSLKSGGVLWQETGPDENAAVSEETRWANATTECTRISLPVRWCHEDPFTGSTRRNVRMPVAGSVSPAHPHTAQM